MGSIQIRGNEKFYTFISSFWRKEKAPQTQHAIPAKFGGRRGAECLSTSSLSLSLSSLPTLLHGIQRETKNKICEDNSSINFAQPTNIH